MIKNCFVSGNLEIQLKEDNTCRCSAPPLPLSQRVQPQKCNYDKSSVMGTLIGPFYHTRPNPRSVCGTARVLSLRMLWTWSECDLEEQSLHVKMDVPLNKAATPAVRRCRAVLHSKRSRRGGVDGRRSTEQNRSGVTCQVWTQLQYTPGTVRRKS